MTVIGFTGTRLGMTSWQRQSLDVLLNLIKPDEVHHGDCIGSDEQFHRICQLRKLRIVIHPPDNPAARANCVGGIVVAPRPYLERNKDIVESADILIAAPKGPEQFQGSGTWQTIRWAKRWKKIVIIINPEGGLEWRRVGYSGRVGDVGGEKSGKLQ